MIMRRRTLLAAMVSGFLPPLAIGQGRRPRLAILSPASRIGSGDPGAVYGPFTAALAALGWVRERNVDIVERFADFAVDRLPALAAELVSLQPDVIFTNTSPGAYAAAAATPTIPIVVGPAGRQVWPSWPATSPAQAEMSPASSLPSPWVSTRNASSCCTRSCRRSRVWR
jgi:putative ABC transport system substrate-binding protein